MRTFRRTLGQVTSFVVADLSPALREAALSLYYTPCAEGFAKAYPADTPGLERIYATWAASVAPMLRQAAGLAPAPWDETLLNLLRLCEGQDLSFWLTGSAALAVRGLDLAPKDLDLVTDGHGAQRLGQLLAEHLVEPVSQHDDWIADWWGRAFWGARIEWVGDLHDREVERGVVSVPWRGYAVRVSPLAPQLRDAELRGQTERAAQIRRLMAEG